MNNEAPHTDTPFNLPKYQKLINGIGVSAPLFFAGVIGLSPYPYFSFLGEKVVVVTALVGISAISWLLFYWVPKSNNVFMHHVSHVAWSLFQFAIIWESGGVTSPFVVLLIFPLLTAAADLMPTQMRRIGIANILIFALLPVFQPEYWTNYDVQMIHLFQLFFLSLITAYLIKIVEETLRHRIEKEEASKKYFQLAEVDQVKSDFIMVVSHQLRTPLTAARYALHEYEENTDPKLREAFVHQATKRIDTSTEMVNEMLKSIELGLLSIRRDWITFDVCELLAEVKRELQFESDKTHASVRLETPQKLPVFGAREVLKVAFAHIIENAIRYGGGKEVIVRAEKRDEHIEITIIDYGIGIEANDLPHVFDRFYRAKNAMRLYPNESGIGLFTAKSIINRHSGEIVIISSSSGKGTTFLVTLPLHERPIVQ